MIGAVCQDDVARLDDLVASKVPPSHFVHYAARKVLPLLGANRR
jgi:hypothetical protein